MTKVSILTPSFNQVAWLGYNLSSVRNQTHTHIEHIVMDGGSTDGSTRLFENAEPSLMWTSQPDGGQSDALNKAFRASSGDIIGWLNSDDAYADRRAIARAVEAFALHSDVGVVYGHSLLVNRDNRVLQFMWAPPYGSKLLDHFTPFLQPSVFIRRSVLADTLVDEGLDYVMDRDLWLRLLQTTRFQRVNAIFAIDRYQPDRKTLQQGYLVEASSYNQSRNFDPTMLTARLIRTTFGPATRVAGTPRMLALPLGIDPAIKLRFGSRRQRARLQLLTHRSNMPFGTETQ